MQKLPEARNTAIITQSAGKEVLLYDLITHKAYCLNETSGAVYQACNGKTSFDELKISGGLTDDIIYLALDELKKENLLKADEEYQSPFAGMSRREVIRKVGFASMIALPVISSLVAPTAAMAQSGRIACTTMFEGDQGSCPTYKLRCVNSFCKPCTPFGQPIPGGGRCYMGDIPSILQCCSRGCEDTTGTCQ